MTSASIPCLASSSAALEGVGHADAEADDGHVLARALDLGLAEGDGEVVHDGTSKERP
jgi:hypothetical protein